MQAVSPDLSKQASAGTPSTAKEHANILQNYASDPKFKKYTQQVEKCLSSFDNVQEWADFISFLKQLLKTFQSYLQFKEIPRKLIVSKRLSQCLNPALPTGVHQRALDVYSHILAVLGSEGLKRDLALWSSGLFPFFQYAATSVKPTLLNLYDTHFLPLQKGLRPIMKSFIVALLPGLEEETGEWFDKVLEILDRLAETVSSSFFLQNIWLIMLTNPPARGTAYNYLSRRLPTLSPEEDITFIVGRDIGLMIRAFAAALEDDNLLVRRAALDLLVTALRLDSVSVKNSRAEDRAILMRAAYSVILRRDLALNRRLYLWLLGPAENAKQQDIYFREHSLELLKTTLEEEMFKPSAEYSESRPFKIFVSLLDKWEIGGPLTEVLVYNAFKAIKLTMETYSENIEDMTMTASTLYEAVEPHTVWKQLLNSVILEILGQASEVEAIQMVKFVLGSFHVRDEEIQTIHLPVVLSALSEAIRTYVEEVPSRARLASVREALALEEEILRHIPNAALKQRHALNGEVDESTIKQGPLAFACAFYELGDFSLRPVARQCCDVPFVSTLEDLVTLSIVCAKGLLDPSGDVSSLREVFNHSVLLIKRLLGRMDQQSDSPFAIHWDPSQWLSAVIECLEQPTSSFTMVDRVVSLAVALHESQILQPKLIIDNRSTMFKMVSLLLRYLRPEYAVYHVRSVNLIWQLENASQQPHVQSIISQSLASPQSRNNQGAYEAFGVLWRLSDDVLLPGFKLKVPVIITLDTLKSDDPTIRQIGETWMRCSLRSYLRVLDPILYDLLDPAIRRLPSETKLHGRELHDYAYEGPLDQRLVNHLLDTLLSIVRYGGQGFAKVARSTPIRRSLHPGLIERAEASGTGPEGASYLDVLVELLIRLLQSEVKNPRLSGMRAFNATTQSLSVDLLQAVVARGEIDQLALETIEAAVVGKLYFSVHASRLDLQNKLLHLLHSVISALTTIGPAPLLTHHTRPDLLSEISAVPEVGQDSTYHTYNINPLLTQTLIDGIATSANRPVLQHWLDFILMTVPQFHQALQAVVAPLIDCICRQLRSAMTEVVGAHSKRNESEDIRSSTTDAELTMFLHAIERLLLLSLSKPTGTAEIEDESSFPEKQSDGSGLLGYVSTVFSSESVVTAPEEQLTARSTAYRSLHGGVSVLYSIWIASEWTNPQPWTPKDDSLSYIYNKTRARCRRVLEHLFRANSSEVLESIVDCWNADTIKPSSEVTSAFQLVDVLTSSAQTVVHMLCESISCRLPVISEKHRKTISNINLTDAILFRFLENYVKQLEGPVAMQVWGRFMQLAKDIGGSLKDLKIQAFYMLRCLSVLADKVIQTTAMEDRRLRKELQETYGRLLDSCVLSISRLDQGTWIRRSTKDPLVVNGRESPIPQGGPDTKLDEKATTSTLEAPKPAWGPEFVDQITQYIASDAIPQMRKFLMDNDKSLAACNNIIYYVVNPSLKGKTRTLDLDPLVMELLREMSRMNIVLKAWRSPVLEALNDGRFFSSSPTTGRKWRPIVRALIDTDKTAFTEVLNKVTATSSTNIFGNREAEMLSQSQNLRRLSYVLFIGDKNQFLAQLPTVQEKLVDTLRSVSAPIVQSEVYLCVRVLLCRLSAHNLTSFWPVILTELYRLFEQALANVPSDGSEDLPLILSACKVLDLLLVLQTEEFQIHQWVFITDTVDAIYRPDNWSPDAMMDRLAEVANYAPSSQGGAMDRTEHGGTPIISTFVDSAHPMRKPMLNSVKQIESIRDLAPFFSSVSITSYESVYASGGSVDWDGIETGLMNDMFEGS